MCRTGRETLLLGVCAAVFEQHGLSASGHPHLDATFVNARWVRTVEKVSALVVGPDGHRDLSPVIDRGVRLVISDEHAGLVAALRRWLPEVPKQRCTVHLQRNVLTKAPPRLRQRPARDVGTLFTASSLAEAKQRLATVTARWSKELPEAMACLTRGFAAATTSYQFPAAHWRRIRTTNSLERLHGDKQDAEWAGRRMAHLTPVVFC